MKGQLLLALVASTVFGQNQPNVHEIIARSSELMEANWKEAPHYTYLEHDVTTKHGGAKVVRTVRVLMIEGSQYNKLIALNGEPLSPEEEKKQDQKLLAEIKRRQHESPEERDRRVAKYNRERRQDHLMMKEMVNAFNYTLQGENELDGHKVWVLKATPNPNYQPINQEAKVLTGMEGELWIDQKTYQWVKVTARVIHPVSMFILARVSPGTKFELIQAPVGNGIWLPKYFSQDVVASALFFLNEDSTDKETYREYTPMPSASQLLAWGGQVRLE